MLPARQHVFGQPTIPVSSREYQALMVLTGVHVYYCIFWHQVHLVVQVCLICVMWWWCSSFLCREPRFALLLLGHHFSVSERDGLFKVLLWWLRYHLLQRQGLLGGR